MHGYSRRHILKMGVATALSGTLGGYPLLSSAAKLRYTPEKGARLRVLRWKQFVQGEFEAFVANTRRFTELTGVDIKLETDSWEDVRPKAVVAADLGGGPDIIFGTNDDPHRFPDKLVDLTDLAEDLGKRYGGWYETPRAYATSNGRWISLPQGGAPSCMVYRVSHLKAAGFERFPEDLPGFLHLCRQLKKNGTPAGFALGHATADANSFVHWCLWAHGGMVVDANDHVVLDSPQSIAAINYMREIQKTLPWDTMSWLDPSNNKAFHAGEISLTNNGGSIYAVAKNSADPRLQAIARDIGHAHFPIGPVGRPTEFSVMFFACLFKYSKYPNAAREYLRFLWEREQVDPWMIASNGYVSHALAAYEKNPVWTADPLITPYRDGLKRVLTNGYAGKLGAASAAVMGDFIVVDMFADACSGTRTPKEAARRAAERARRHYRT